MFALGKRKETNDSSTMAIHEIFVKEVMLCFWLYLGPGRVGFK
jgi:hypothetical protein